MALHHLRAEAVRDVARANAAHHLRNGRNVSDAQQHMRHDLLLILPVETPEGESKEIRDIGDAAVAEYYNETLRG